MDFPERLRALLAERGISQRALARKVPCSTAAISLYVNGLRRPSPAVARRLDEVLDAGGALAALAAPRPPALDPEQRARLDWAARHPRRLDLAAVQALAVLLDAQRHAEDTLGSAAILQPVMAHLAAVSDLAAESRGSVRTAMVDVAGQWAQFAGWLHASVRDDAAAIRLNDQALGQAIEAGNASLASEAISMKGHVAWMAGHPGAVIGLSQAAQRDPSAFPGQHAISAAQEARGHAMTGDADTAERRLDDAMASARAADEQRGDAPPWLYYHSPAFFELQRGIVLAHFAAVPRYHDLALAALETGYAGLPPDEQASEWGAGYLVHIAAVHERAGEAERAAAVALEAARIALQTGSPRLRGMLAPLAARLNARMPDDSDVAELARALA